MAGIDSFNPLLYSQSQLALETKKNKKEEESKKTKGLNHKFSNLLHKAQEIPITDSILPMEVATMEFEEAVAFLMDEVTMSGEKLKNSPLPDIYADYKQKITQFLHFVVENSYDVKSQTGIRNPRTKIKRKYTIVSVVNEKLDQLAKDILYLQSSQISLLAKIEEINGILVDLIS